MSVPADEIDTSWLSMESIGPSRAEMTVTYVLLSVLGAVIAADIVLGVLLVARR